MISHINIRSVIWPIICKIDELKQEFVEDFKLKNK